LVALALYHNAGYSLLQSRQNEHAARFQTGRVSANDLTQLEGVALVLHENEDVLSEEGNSGKICIGRAAAKTVDCAFFPIYKVNFVELITTIVAREND